MKVHYVLLRLDKTPHDLYWTKEESAWTSDLDEATRYSSPNDALEMSQYVKALDIRPLMIVILPVSVTIERI